MTDGIEPPASTPILPRCPFLGIQKDPDVFVNSPSRTNFCHKSAPGVFPAYSLQKKICLTSVFSQCPVYVKPEKSKIPDDLRWKPPLSLEGGLLGWVSVPLLTAGFAMLIVVVGIQNSWWQSIPLAPIEPRITEMMLTATNAATPRPTEAAFPLVISPGSTSTLIPLQPSLTSTQIPFLERIFPRNPTATATIYNDLPPFGPTPPALIPTPTASRTPTRTPTPTHIGSASPTRTGTATFTLTFTPTPSFTLTPTLTETDIFTPTSTTPPEDTNTPKPTPTHKNTQKPTNTPRPTQTPTDTPDPSLPTPTPRPTDDGPHD